MSIKEMVSGVSKSPLFGINPKNFGTRLNAGLNSPFQLTTQEKLLSLLKTKQCCLCDGSESILPISKQQRLSKEFEMSFDERSVALFNRVAKRK